jgi:NTE family protein
MFWGLQVLGTASLYLPGLPTTTPSDASFNEGSWKMKSYIAVFAMALVLALANSVEVSAQQASSQARPKIGLVLAGGGAKGAAHVGVIKVLEELGVPIDYIAGTSMGAIVGGLYASGMSADQLADAVRSIDWNDIFNDKPARENRDFRRKLDDEGFLTKYKFGFKDGKFQLPRGVVDGQKLNLALRSLAIRAVGIQDFDKLPIPFRAVAADIETGESVVLGSGDLGTAMRASMAVSAVFPPVEIDGRLLVDGGLTNNLPMDVARQMGADILIVVNFPSPLKKRKDLNSAASILFQSLDLLIKQNSRIQLKTLRPEDVYIEPKLGDIGAGSFDRAADAIPLGEQAARLLSSRLKKLARPRSALRLSAVGPRSQEAKPITVDYIRIENKSRLSDDLITSRLRLRPGDRLDFKELEQDLANIFGLNYFETVDYRIVKKDGKTGIVVIATEKSAGLDSFRFGLNLENNFDGDSAYNVSVRYQKEGLNELGGELILEAIAGEKLGASAAFLQPLDPATRYFITPNISFLERDVPTFVNGSRVAEFRVSTLIAGLSVARQLANWGAISLGVDVGHGWEDVNIGAPSVKDDDYGIGEIFARLNVDTLDNLFFPHTGEKAKVEFRRSTDALGGDESFSRVNLQLLVARTWGRNTLLVSANGGATFDGAAPTHSLFNLGGLFNLSGFETDELSGENYALGSILGYRNIGARSGMFNFPVYLGASLEAGNVWDETGDMGLNDLILAGTAFIGVDTPLGPVYLAYGHAEGGNQSVYLFLGQTF